MPDIVAPIIPNVKFDPEIFVSAFQKALAQKAKQNDLERKIEQMNNNYAFKEHQLDYQNEWHTQQAQAANDRLGVAQERLGFQKDVNDYKEKRKAEEDTAEQNIVNGLGNIKAREGTPEYWNEVSKVVANNPQGLRGKIAPQLILKSTGDHLKTQTTLTKLFNNQIHNDGFTSYDALEHPYVENDPNNPWKKNKDGSYYTTQGTKHDPNDPTGTKFIPNVVTLKPNDYEDRMAAYDELHPGRGTGRPAPKMEKELDTSTARAIRDKIRANNPSISNEQLSAQIGQVARSQGYTVP